MKIIRARYLGIALLLALTACGGGSSGGPGGKTAQDATHLYVVSQFDRAVYVYDIAADGSFSGPTRSITGALTGITNPISLIVDSLGALYVVNYQESVVVFEPGATGNAAPKTTLATDTFPVYIGNNGSDGYALIANKVKSDASTATIYLGRIYTSAVPVGSYVSTESPFTVPNARSFATSPIPNLVTYSVWTCLGVAPPSSNGSATCYGNPVLPGPTGYVMNQGISIPATPNAVAFRDDGALIIANQNAYMSPSNISIWPMPGEGATVPPGMPSAKISGIATGLVSPVHVFFDATSDTIYVADTGNASYQGSVKTWSSSADGDVAPDHMISGLNYPFAVAVGP